MVRGWFGIWSVRKQKLVEEFFFFLLRFQCVEGGKKLLTLFLIFSFFLFVSFGRFGGGIWCPFVV